MSGGGPAYGTVRRHPYGTPLSGRSAVSIWGRGMFLNMIEDIIGAYYRRLAEVVPMAFIRE